MKVMLVVTGLMGAGHLTRILLIAKALKAAGAMPLIVNGGREFRISIPAVLIWKTSPLSGPTGWITAAS